MMNRLKIRPRRLAMVVSAGCVAVMMQGCSSTPRPDAELAGAKTALISADNQDSSLYAPVSMDRAREKLQRAEQAMAKKNYDEARRLSEEAQADAELAQATTDRTEAEEALHEMKLSIQVLREEILRSQNR